jgi:hypothetical protein
MQSVPGGRTAQKLPPEKADGQGPAAAGWSQAITGWRGLDARFCRLDLACGVQWRRTPYRIH